MPPSTRNTRASLAGTATTLTSALKATKSTSSLPSKTLKRTSSSTSIPATPTKRSKLTKTVSAPPAPSDEPLKPFPIFDLTKTSSHIIPSSDLHFDFQDGKKHLIEADGRFQKVFEKLKCRPFEDLEDVDPFRSLITSIIGQQVSWLAARSINHKFRRLFNPSLPEKAAMESEGLPGVPTYFPSPEDVMQLDIPQLKSAGLSTRKAEYVRSVAEHFLDSRLSSDLLANGSVQDVSKALIDIRGIGQWTVDMFLIFTLRRGDILPVGDLGVQKGLIKWILSAYANIPYPSEESLAFTSLPSHTGPSPSILTEIPHTPPMEETSVLPAPETPEHNPVAVGGIVFPPTPNSSADRSLDGPKGSAIAGGLADKLSETEKAKAKKRLEASLHLCPEGYKPEVAYPLEGIEGMSVETLKGRLAGKKLKGGAYLSPAEMEILTARWKPYRSLGSFYMWAVAEESS